MANVRGTATGRAARIQEITNDIEPGDRLGVGTETPAK